MVNLNIFGGIFEFGREWPMRACWCPQGLDGACIWHLRANSGSEEKWGYWLNLSLRP